MKRKLKNRMFAKVAIMLIAIMFIPFGSSATSEKSTSEHNRLYLYVSGESGLGTNNEYYCSFNANDPKNSGLDAGIMGVGLPLATPCEIIYPLEPDLKENFSADIEKNATSQITLSVYTTLPANAILPLTCKVNVLVEDWVVLYGSSDVIVTPFVENEIKMMLEWAENATQDIFQKNHDITVRLNFENYSPSLYQIIVRHNGSSYCDLPIYSPVNETNMMLDKTSEGISSDENAIPDFELFSVVFVTFIAMYNSRKR